MNVNVKMIRLAAVGAWVLYEVVESDDPGLAPGQILKVKMVGAPRPLLNYRAPAASGATSRAAEAAEEK